MHILESHMPDSQEYKNPDKCNPHFLRLPFSLTLQDYLNVFSKSPFLTNNKNNLDLMLDVQHLSANQQHVWSLVLEPEEA